MKFCFTQYIFSQLDLIALSNQNIYCPLLLFCPGSKGSIKFGNWLMILFMTSTSDQTRVLRLIYQASAIMSWL